MNQVAPIVAEKVARKAHNWARDEHEYYTEPYWCSERLFDVETFDGIVWDPACGSGRIIRSAASAGHPTRATDIVDRGPHFEHYCDFVAETTFGICSDIVTNPPFKLADEFARKALEMATGKVAFLLPVKWLSGDKRSRWLATTPLKRIWLLTPRPSMPPGKLIEAGMKPSNGTVDFCWVVWERGHTGPATIDWLRRDG